MALSVICPGEDVGAWVEALRGVDPGIDVRVWPDDAPREEVDLVLTWNHPPGELRRYPKLRCIASMGAGVDHILLRDPDLPDGVPVTRIVDPSLAAGMAEYVVLAVLRHFRQFETYREQQREHRWHALPRPRPQHLHVGILGMGEIGATVARALVPFGFPVAGWSRTPKRIEGVESFAGDGELDALLERSDVLVCLLPLTPQTRNILDRRTLGRLPRGAYLINVGRGPHLVDEDLLAALADEQLSGACLDVFREEPLPVGHPFWDHPKILLTPHVSSLTDPVSCAPQLVENYRRARAGTPLLNPVEPGRAY